MQQELDQYITADPGVVVPEGVRAGAEIRDGLGIDIDNLEVHTGCEQHA